MYEEEVSWWVEVNMLLDVSEQSNLHWEAISVLEWSMMLWTEAEHFIDILIEFWQVQIHSNVLHLVCPINV